MSRDRTPGRSRRVDPESPETGHCFVKKDLWGADILALDYPKCNGLIMLERFSDFFLVFYAWKCVNCGAIIDRTICQNRKMSLATKAAKENQPAAA